MDVRRRLFLPFARLLSPALRLLLLLLWLRLCLLLLCFLVRAARCCFCSTPAVPRAAPFRPPRSPGMRARSVTIAIAIPSFLPTRPDARTQRSKRRRRKRRNSTLYFGGPRRSPDPFADPARTVFSLLLGRSPSTTSLHLLLYIYFSFFFFLLLLFCQCTVFSAETYSVHCTSSPLPSPCASFRILLREGSPPARSIVCLHLPALKVMYSGSLGLPRRGREMNLRK